MAQTSATTEATELAAAIRPQTFALYCARASCAGVRGVAVNHAQNKNAYPQKKTARSDRMKMIHAIARTQATLRDNERPFSSHGSARARLGGNRSIPPPPPPAAGHVAAGPTTSVNLN